MPNAVAAASAGQPIDRRTNTVATVSRDRDNLRAEMELEAAKELSRGKVQA